MCEVIIFAWNVFCVDSNIPAKAEKLAYSGETRHKSCARRFYAVQRYEIK